MKFSDKAKDVIGILAPTLATALGGPLAGVATKALTDAFSGKGTSEIEDIILSGSPEAVAELKKLEADMKLKEQELDIRFEEIAAGDRKDARELLKATSMVPQVILSAIFTVGYFYVIVGILAGELSLPSGQETLVASLIGVLTVGQIKVLDFWLGSSAGSKIKTIVSGGQKVSG